MKSSEGKAQKYKPALLLQENEELAEAVRAINKNSENNQERVQGQK